MMLSTNEELMALLVLFWLWIAALTNGHEEEPPTLASASELVDVVFILPK